MNITTAMPLERIREAESAVSARLAATPLVELRGLTTPEGRTILIKAEGLQPTGSFKVRGALNRIIRLSEAERAAGVVAYSTGNHAQAVAWAARAFGIAATVVMSPDVPHNKVEATRRLGADVVMAAATSDARRALAERLTHERGAALVAPYDDLNVIAGQATIATEILRQTHHEPPAALYVPIGGGGLLAGIAAAVKHLHPATQVIGVEPELEADAWRSFQTGILSRLDRPSESIADAIKIQELGRLTWPLIHRHADDVVTVSEAQIAHACRIAVDLANIVIEPGGAVGLAAALQDHRRIDHGGPVVVVAGGGNVDLATLAKIAGIGEPAYG
ncbi:threonine ammonia-lyase [Nonomuraea sp. KM88]|uniref:threonine ammonia-lyase n=1 Tax=Nonomuraea sp. KM88 TaxID=3457427 RepID=UPI003FCDCF4C